MHKLQILDNGSASFIHASNKVAGGGRGWHLLGKVAEGDGYMKISEMLTGADLDGELSKVPLFGKLTIDGVEYVMTAPDKMGVARQRPGTNQGEIISVVGEGHEIFQPYEVFAWGQNLLDAGQATGVTAGTMCDGKLIFCCFRLPSQILVGGIDPIDLYLTILDSYDGSRKLTAAVTPIRAECFNTVTAGIAAAAKAQRVWTLKHLRNADPNSHDNIERARKALTISSKYAEALERQANEMLSRKITKQKFQNIIQQEFGPKAGSPTQREESLWNTKRDALMTAWSSPNLGDVKGTVWAAWNAMVEYSDWFKPIRYAGKDEGARAAARLSRSFSSMGGEMDTEKVRFQKVLMAATR